MKLFAVLSALLSISACAAPDQDPEHAVAPVLFAIDPSVKEISTTVIGAANEWNNVLGRTAFVRCALEDARPHITVTLLAPEEHTDSAGWTTYKRRGALSSTQGTIWLRVPHMRQLRAHQALGIAVHEFGHVLNVPHDSDDQSVMRGTFVPAEWQITDAVLAAATRSVTR